MELSCRGLPAHADLAGGGQPAKRGSMRTLRLFTRGSKYWKWNIRCTALRGQRCWCLSARAARGVLARCVFLSGGYFVQVDTYSLQQSFSQFDLLYSRGRPSVAAALSGASSDRRDCIPDRQSGIFGPFRPLHSRFAGSALPVRRCWRAQILGWRAQVLRLFLRPAARMSEARGPRFRSSAPSQRAGEPGSRTGERRLA